MQPEQENFMAKFEHMGGGAHDHNDGNVYKKGDVITTASDLEKQFPGKFRRLTDHTPSTPTPAVPVAAEAPTSAATGGKKTIQIKPKVPGPKDARGENVTSDYPEAPKGLNIFQRGDSFHLYEGDKTDPINTKGLKKGDVLGAVMKYLEE